MPPPESDEPSKADVLDELDWRNRAQTAGIVPAPTDFAERLGRRLSEEIRPKPNQSQQQDQR